MLLGLVTHIVKFRIYLLISELAAWAIWMGNITGFSTISTSTRRVWRRVDRSAKSNAMKWKFGIENVLELIDYSKRQSMSCGSNANVIENIFKLELNSANPVIKELETSVEPTEGLCPIIGADWPGVRIVPLFWRGPRVRVENWVGMDWLRQDEDCGWGDERFKERFCCLLLIYSLFVWTPNTNK